MGRPPLSLDDVTVKTTLRLPRKLLARVEAITGEKKMSGWVRQAIEEKLAREEPEAIEEPASGPPDSTPGHPRENVP